MATMASMNRKIMEIGVKIQAENEAKNRDTIPRDLNLNLSSPRSTPRTRPKLFSPTSGFGLPPPSGNGTPAQTRKQLDLPFGPNSISPQQPKSPDGAEIEAKLQDIMKLSGLLTIDGKQYKTSINDLEHLGELGNGTCGHVVKMRHKLSSEIIAVKQMRRTGNRDENKRIIMDLEVVLKSNSCPWIVLCLGCFITDSDVWICMELMATCMEKLMRKLKQPFPEPILGKITVATLKALHYLKEIHGVIHRDVKPSNILLDDKGKIKLCDFGISGRLVDSKAKTRSAGCAAYMAPERIDPPDPKRPDYDIRADVWSLGITLVELATGYFPYRDCKTDFEVLTRVLQDDPPLLSPNQNFSHEFCSFVKDCLTKDYKKRPKYRKLLEHPFIKKYETAEVDVGSWFADVMKQCNQASGKPPPAPPPPQQVNSVPEHPPMDVDLDANHTSKPESSSKFNFLCFSRKSGHSSLPSGDNDSNRPFFRRSNSQRSQSGDASPTQKSKKTFGDLLKFSPSPSRRWNKSSPDKAPKSMEQSPTDYGTRWDGTSPDRMNKYWEPDKNVRSRDRSSPEKLVRKTGSGRYYSTTTIERPIAYPESPRTFQSYHSYDNSMYNYGSSASSSPSPSHKHGFSFGTPSREGSPVVPPRKFLSREQSPVSPIPPRRLSRENHRDPGRLSRESSPGAGSHRLFALQSPTPSARRFFTHEGSPVRRMNSEGGVAAPGSPLRKYYGQGFVPQHGPLPPVTTVRRRASDSGSAPNSPPHRFGLEPYVARPRYTPEPTRKYYY